MSDSPPPPPLAPIWKSKILNPPLQTDIELSIYDLHTRDLYIIYQNFELSQFLSGISNLAHQTSIYSGSSILRDPTHV